MNADQSPESQLPHEGNQETPKKNSFLQKILDRSSVFVSVLIHTLLLLLTGGLVLVPGYIEKTTFVAHSLPPITDMEEPPPDFEEMTLEDPGGGGGDSSVPVENVGTEVVSDSELVLNDFIASTAPTSMSLPSSTGPVAGTSLGMGSGPGMGGGSGGGSGGGTGRGIGKGKGALFGSTKSGNDMLEGTFYDLKQTPAGKDTSMDRNTTVQVISNFVKSGFSAATLKEYYRASQKLYTSQIYIPEIDAKLAPEFFKVADQVQPKMWVIHYHGDMAVPITGEYRFVGFADDVLIVGLDRKPVFNGSYDAGWVSNSNAWSPVPYSQTTAPSINAKNAQGKPMRIYAGPWIQLNQGKNTISIS